jgi:D-lyxose ketol-isomerase
VPGEPTVDPKAQVPHDKQDTFTVWREVILNPGEQYTLAPNTLHWFQGGPEGAIVSEFSSTSRDEADIFTDPEIQRITRVAQ